MAVESMERKAADNKYLHRHFHNLFNSGLNYLEAHYGKESVIAYLRQYARHYYVPLGKAIREQGLAPLERYFRDIYEAEEVPDALETELRDGQLTVKIQACPGVSFIKASGEELSELYGASSKVVFETLAEEAGISYRLVSYEDGTGRAEHWFSQKGRE